MRDAALEEEKLTSCEKGEKRKQRSFYAEAEMQGE